MNYPGNRVLKLFFLFILLPGFIFSQSAKSKNKTQAQKSSKSDTIRKISLDRLFDKTDLEETRDNSNLSGISIKDFGAVGDGVHDDYKAIQSACDYAIKHPAVVIIPVGNYLISHPIVLQNVVNGQYQFFTIHIRGLLPNKSASNEYISRITCGFKSGFGIGIQMGRGITIENITLLGQYTFPNSINIKNIATTKFDDWNNGSVTDKRYAPYAGIVIDPFCDSNAIALKDGYDGLRSFYRPLRGYGGSSGVDIKQCSIRQFMVGVALTPNPQTANDEMINLLDDNIESVRVAIAVGQDQSKEIHIDRFKCWASTHTILDGLTYGQRIGGGSVMIHGMNIAGTVNQLFYLYTDRFPISAINVYSESIFKIGTVGRGAGANFINFQIDFISEPGMPAPDFIISGTANFYGGCLRYYDGSLTHRMNLVNTQVMLRDITLNNFPIITGLYGRPQNIYPVPVLDYVAMYYKRSWRDTLIRLTYIPTINVDRKTWTSSFKGSVPGKVGDYVLGAGRGCYDQGLQNAGCPTIQIGRITSINGDIVNMDDVGVNVYPETKYDAVYISALR
jgi:hypothetical protein